MPADRGGEGDGAGRADAVPAEFPGGDPGDRRHGVVARKDGCHALRRTYASMMPEAGESGVTLARWLGHSAPAITLAY